MENDPLENVNTLIVEQDKIGLYEEGVEKILECVGHPEALATDLSQVFDFSTPFDKDEELDQLVKLSGLMGRPVNGLEYIWELGKELMEKK
mgnify:CR=1 FL=1